MVATQVTGRWPAAVNLKMPTTTSSCIKTIRADPAVINAILDSIEKAPLSNRATKRGEGRYPVRIADAVMALRLGGAAHPTNYAIVPFDLSENGIGFIHGGFLHPGTKCKIVLTSRHGRRNKIPAEIRHCTLLSASVHRIGAAFDSRISVVDYTVAAIPTWILLADDNPMIHRLVENYMKCRNTSLVLSRDGEQAVEEAMKRSYDVIFMDLEMPVLDGLKAVRKLRSLGYPSPIVALTASTDPAIAEKCLEAGFDEYLTKPCSKGDFIGAVDRFRKEPLVSSMTADTDMQPLIEDFVIELQSISRNISKHHEAKDTASLVRECRGLKGVAASFGFNPISDFAKRVEISIQNKEPIELVNQAVVALIHLCAAARA